MCRGVCHYRVIVGGGTDGLKSSLGSLNLDGGYLGTIRQLAHEVVVVLLHVGRVEGRPLREVIHEHNAVPGEARVVAGKQH